MKDVDYKNMTRVEYEAYVREYAQFMYNPANTRNCKNCPENRGESSWIDDRLPCGQYHCWVTMHCKHG